ncbi:MAG: chemotaxis protein CheX [Planctomycetota bacterium]|nr:MAG: chemotaxis protein CheX [Planctomycetota bacterium]
MDFEYLHPIIEATARIFRHLFQLEIRPLEYFYTHQERTQNPILCEVTGMIHFSNGVKGSLYLYLPQNLARKLIQKMLSLAQSDSLDKRILADGVGELTNLICGNSKEGLSKMCRKIELSLPHVIFGKSYKIMRPRDTVGLATLLDSEDGKFIIELNIKTNPNKEEKKLFSSLAH